MKDKETIDMDDLQKRWNAMKENEKKKDEK